MLSLSYTFIGLQTIYSYLYESCLRKLKLSIKKAENKISWILRAERKKNFSSLNALPITNSTAANGINMFFLENRSLIHLRGRKTLLRPTGFVYYGLFSFLLMQQTRFHLGQIWNRKMCFFCSQIKVKCCCGKA